MNSYKTKILVLAMLVVGVCCAWQSSAWATDGRIGIYVDDLSLSVPALAYYDMKNMALIVTNGDYAATKSNILTAYSGATWIPELGIGSSTARTTNTGINKVSMAVVTGAEVAALPGAHTKFMDETFGSGWVMTYYTWAGDVDLSGQATATDLGRVQFAINHPGSVPIKNWTNGDVNFSGTITPADLGIVQASINHHGTAFTNPWTLVSGSGSPPPSGSSSSVDGSNVTAAPEPSSLILFTTALISAMLIWRKKTKR
jgi:hypothetical protein